MLVKRTAMALAAASFLIAAGSVSVSAQEHCGSMYQRVMRAYQMQSPQYGQMLNHYTARCLTGSSSQPTWGGDYRRQRHDTYDNDRRGGYDNDYWRRGW